jgi:dipeptidyl aminopeptidase/acylaminoacyl peptidase
MHMKIALSLAFAMVSVMTAETAELATQEKKQRQYTAPDGGVRVVIVPVSKEAGRSEYESRIEFKSRDAKIACALDYSSEDNEHGFGIVKAEWTPDSQYFVFSLTSSGGHQPWHPPTQFLSRQDGTVRSLDDYFAAAGISKTDFRLIAPNTVETEVWEDKSVPVSVKLAVLPPLPSRRKSKPFLINCAGGHVFKPD